MAAPVIGALGPALSNGLPTAFVAAPTWVDAVALTANTAATYTIPKGAHVLRLTPSVVPTYGNLNAAAVIPVAGVTNGSASFPVVSQTYLGVVSGLSALSLICASACEVLIEVWS